MSSQISSAFTVRAQLHNSTLPAANTNLISDITGPSTAGVGAVKYVIYACSSVIGNYILRRTRSAVIVSEQLNQTATVAGAVYTFKVLVDQGENYQRSV